jgi:sugar phosphate isomerase/epimerase
VKLGVGSYTFRWAIGRGTFRPASPLGAVAFVEKAAEFGVGLVQFADNLPLDALSAAELNDVRAAALALDVEIEVGTQGLAASRVATYLGLADALGARLVRLSVDREDIASSPEATAAPLRDVLPRCVDHDVRLAIENHFFVSSAFLERVVRAVADPHVGVCVDTGNSMVVWERPADTVAQLAPYALSLHLKDFRAEPDPDGVGFRVVGAPLGRGDLDAAAVLKVLRDAGRDVNVILEHWLPRADDERTTLAREDAWLRESVGAARKLGVVL